MFSRFSPVRKESYQLLRFSLSNYLFRPTFQLPKLSGLYHHNNPKHFLCTAMITGDNVEQQFVQDIKTIMDKSQSYQLADEEVKIILKEIQTRSLNNISRLESGLTRTSTAIEDFAEVEYGFLENRQELMKQKASDFHDELSVNQIIKDLQDIYRNYFSTEETQIADSLQKNLYQDTHNLNSNLEKIVNHDTLMPKLEDTLKAVREHSVSHFIIPNRVFISFAYPTSENEKRESWLTSYLEHLRTHLQLAGVNVFFSPVDSRVGVPIFKGMGLVKSSKKTILIGTASLLEKHNKGISAITHELAEIQEKRAIDRAILPLLFREDLKTAFPAWFNLYSNVYPWHENSYLINLKFLLRELFEVGVDSPKYNDLWSPVETLYAETFDSTTSKVVEPSSLTPYSNELIKRPGGLPIISKSLLKERIAQLLVENDNYTQCLPVKRSQRDAILLAVRSAIKETRDFQNHTIGLLRNPEWIKFGKQTSKYLTSNLTGLRSIVEAIPPESTAINQTMIRISSVRDFIDGRRSRSSLEDGFKTPVDQEIIQDALSNIYNALDKKTYPVINKDEIHHSLGAVGHYIQRKTLFQENMQQIAGALLHTANQALEVHGRAKINCALAYMRPEDRSYEAWIEKMATFVAHDLGLAEFNVHFDTLGSVFGNDFVSRVEESPLINTVIVIGTHNMLREDDTENTHLFNKLNALLNKRRESGYDSQNVIPFVLTSGLEESLPKHFEDIGDASIFQQGYLSILKALIYHCYSIKPGHGIDNSQTADSLVFASKGKFKLPWERIDRKYYTQMPIEEVRRVVSSHQNITPPKLYFPPTSRYFVGRSDIIDGLEEHLHKSSRQDKLNITVLRGIAGVGKTEIAKRVAERNAHNYSAQVWWVDGKSGQTIARSARDILETFNFPRSMDMDAVKSNFRDKLASDGRKLLIIDAFDTLADIKQRFEELSTYIPSLDRMSSAAQIDVIITSRDFKISQSHAHLKIQDIPVSDFTHTEAQEYIRKILEFEGLSESADDSEELASKLNYFPLLLSQAMGYISTKRCKISEYITILNADIETMDLDTEIFSTPINGSPSDQDSVLWRVWGSSKKALVEQSEDAAELFNLACYMDNKNIYRELFDKYGCFDNAEGVLDEENRDFALAELSRFNFIESLSPLHGLGITSLSSFSIHPKLQEVTRLWLKKTRIKPAEEFSYEFAYQHNIYKVLMMMDKAFTYDRHDIATFNQSERYLSHARTVLQHAKQLAVHSIHIPILYSKIGAYYLYHRRDPERSQHKLLMALNTLDYYEAHQSEIDASHGNNPKHRLSPDEIVALRSRILNLLSCAHHVQREALDQDAAGFVLRSGEYMLPLYLEDVDIYMNLYFGKAIQYNKAAFQECDKLPEGKVEQHARAYALRMKGSIALTKVRLIKNLNHVSEETQLKAEEKADELYSEIDECFAQAQILLKDSEHILSRGVLSHAMGAAELEKGHYDKAIVCFTESLKAKYEASGITPEEVAAGTSSKLDSVESNVSYYKMGEAYLLKKEYFTAKQIFENALNCFLANFDKSHHHVIKCQAKLDEAMRGIVGEIHEPRPDDEPEAPSPGA